MASLTASRSPRPENAAHSNPFPFRFLTTSFCDPASWVEECTTRCIDLCHISPSTRQLSSTRWCSHAHLECSRTFERAILFSLWSKIWLLIHNASKNTNSACTPSIPSRNSVSIPHIVYLSDSWWLRSSLYVAHIRFSDPVSRIVFFLPLYHPRSWSAFFKTLRLHKYSTVSILKKTQIFNF